MRRENCLQFGLILLFLTSLVRAPSLAEGLAEEKRTIFSSKELNQKGITEYRKKNYESAIELFKQALKQAEPSSFDELTAASNLSLVNDAIKDKSLEAWQMKRHSYVLRNKILGDAIPEDYSRETPEEVTEALLEKKVIAAKSVYEDLDAQTKLMRFYQDRHEYSKAKKTYDEIIDSLSQGKSRFALPQDWAKFAEDVGLVEIERGWSEYARTEGQQKEADTQIALARKLEAELPKLRRQEEFREHQREIEKKRQEEEVRKYRQAEEEYKKKQELERYQQDQQLREQAPTLKGLHFYSVGDIGGFLKFIDENSVDIGTRFQVTSPVDGVHMNIGEIPTVLAGTYKLVGTAPNWEIRISSMLKGSSRIDTYRWDILNGKQVLTGGQAPLPFVVSIPSMTHEEYQRLVSEDTSIISGQTKEKKKESAAPKTSK